MASAIDSSAAADDSDLRDILLVDDSESEAVLARAALRQSGANFRISSVGSGQAAIDWLLDWHAAQAGQPSQRPILVLLDMRMPDWDGMRTLAEIRRHPLLGRTAVVFLTSLETTDLDGFYEAGVNAYVVKPGSLPGMVKFLADLDGFWYDHITRGDTLGEAMPSDGAHLVQ